MRRLLVAIVAAAALVLLTGTPASAHDVLLSTSPSDGQTVAQTPSSIVLTFEEPAIDLGTQVLVTGPSGQLASGQARLVGSTVVQDVQPGAPAGRYTVTWRVTSDDGHPVSGTFTFTSSTAGGGTPPAATPSASPAPAADTGHRPLIPSWGWIAAGIVIILGAVRIALRDRRNRRANQESGREP